MLILETSCQVSIFLDLWHACHNLHFIKIRQPDGAEIIPHIDLVALSSHIASRSHRLIQLSCFEVSLFFMSYATFLSLLCFDFCECCLLVSMSSWSRFDVF